MLSSSNNKACKWRLVDSDERGNSWSGGRVDLARAEGTEHSIEVESMPSEWLGRSKSSKDKDDGPSKWEGDNTVGLTLKGGAVNSPGK